MAWNEPGGDKRNSWNRPQQSQNDLDDVVRNFQKRLSALFGRGSGSGGGSTPTPPGFGAGAGGVRSNLYQRNAVRAESTRNDGSWDIEVELELAEIDKLLGKPGVELLKRAGEARTKRVA